MPAVRRRQPARRSTASTPANIAFTHPSCRAHGRPVALAMDSLTRRLRNPLLAVTLLLSPAAAPHAQAAAQTRAPAELDDQTAPTPEMLRWRAEAAKVTITRDSWGIAHIVGKTDADAVFGAIYAQAEDDFGRIEANYLTALGRTAEAEGEKAIWADLRQRLYVDPVVLQK